MSTVEASTAVAPPSPQPEASSTEKPKKPRGKKEKTTPEAQSQPPAPPKDGGSSGAGGEAGGGGEGGSENGEGAENLYVMVVSKKIRGLRKKLDRSRALEQQSQAGKVSGGAGGLMEETEVVGRLGHPPSMCRVCVHGWTPGSERRAEDPTQQ